MYCTLLPSELETKKYARTARAPAAHHLNYEGGGGGRAIREALAVLVFASVSNISAAYSGRSAFKLVLVADGNKGSTHFGGWARCSGV